MEGRVLSARHQSQGHAADYATVFPTVEVNATFRTVPTASTVAGWKAQVPASFVFAVKAPQQITHIRRLVDPRELVRELVRSVRPLGPQLGPILFQLPPNHAAAVSRLTAFLATLPKRLRFAFEFRHPSWFTDAAFAALSKRDAALCSATSDRLETPFEITASWGYVRLRDQAYGRAALQARARRIRAAKWEDAFVYFEHEETGTGPRFARALAALLAKR